MCDRIHKQGHSDLHASGDTIAHYSMYVHFRDETPTIPKVIYIGHVGTYPIMYHGFAPEQAHADNRLQSRCVVRGCDAFSEAVLLLSKAL